MRLLLDTHILIWFASEPERLSAPALSCIEEADERGVSVVSAWEYMLKRSKFPTQLPRPFRDLLAGDFVRLAFPFEAYRHAEVLPPIHSDPFDRMLVAHAIEEERLLLTADERIRRYPVETLW